jgi:hypothetical protein
VPIRCFFAENDKFIPPAAGRKSLRRLKAQGFDVAAMTIPNAGHNAVVVEKTGLRDFFRELIPQRAPPRRSTSSASTRASASSSARYNTRRRLDIRRALDADTLKS